MIKKSVTLFVCICIFNLPAATAQQKNTDLSKHKWAAGIGTGLLHINGDVPAVKTQLHQSLYLYKPFTHWFALRLSYTYGNAKGQHWLASQNFAKNPAWAGKYAAPVATAGSGIVYGYNSNGVFTPATAGDAVYYNYKTTISSTGLCAQFTLPLPFKEPKAGIYFVIGAGALFYKTKVNAAGSSGTYATLFNQLSAGLQGSKKEILHALKNGMDHSYETGAEAYSNQPRFCRHTGAGISYKFKKHFEAGIELIITTIKSDLLDGQRWQEYAYGDAVLSREWDQLVITSLNLKYYF